MVAMRFAVDMLFMVDLLYAVDTHFTVDARLGNIILVVLACIFSLDSTLMPIIACCLSLLSSRARLDAQFSRPRPNYVVTTLVGDHRIGTVALPCLCLIWLALPCSSSSSRCSSDAWCGALILLVLRLLRCRPCRGLQASACLHTFWCCALLRY